MLTPDEYYAKCLKDDFPHSQIGKTTYLEFVKKHFLDDRDIYNLWQKQLRTPQSKQEWIERANRYNEKIRAKTQIKTSPEYKYAI